MSLDETVLRRLLLRGERARIAGASRMIREAFKSMDSAYWTLTLPERDRIHVRLQAAASAGAVILEWARQGGDDRPLDAVRLADLDQLASFLGVSTLAQDIGVARSALAPWADNPRVKEILEVWSRMKQVRSLGTMAAADFADALRVLDATRHPDSEDRVARAVSVALFRESKRIEHLHRHLDVLTADSIGAPARHWSEVYALLGLVKEPQPFLVAGAGCLVLGDGMRCPVAMPYLGVASHAIAHYEGSPSWVMTIENLATFHQSARLLGGGERGLIVYSGGMPSPAWCHAYKAILSSIPIETPAYHWGDVDEGGFRIAAHIRATCMQPNRQFLPWRMDTPPDENFPAVTDAEHRSMVHAATKAGWGELARALRPVWVEQEGLAVRLP